MKLITIPGMEFWDENRQEFVYAKAQTLVLEHSLVSISKWEAKWKKPFISNKEKSIEELVDYIRFMTLTQNVQPDVYSRITADHIREIQQYMEDPMTATWFSKTGQKKSKGRQITSELIYYWMFSMNIPIDCQKWHLNRLLTLIKIFDEENKQPNKRRASDILSSNATKNAARKKRLNTKG